MAVTRSLHRWMTRVVVMLAVVIGGLAGATLAWSLFSTVSPSETNHFAADSLPQGNTPSTSATGGSVHISFSTVNSAGGTQVTAYTVTRYNAYTNANAGTVSGCTRVSSTVSCTDTPGGGGWQYTDTPTYNSWSSTASAKSNAVYNSSLTLTGATSGTVGTTGVSLSGAGYVAGATVNVSSGVTFAGSPLTINATQTVSASGTWSATFTVPNASNGAQTITATDSGGVSASTTFTVIAKLTVAPTSGTVGTTGVTLTGTGYTATKTVNVNSGVTFAGSALTISGSQTVAANGTWSATFTVPNASNGARSIVATDSGGANAGTNFAVIAKLTASPTSGTVGTTGVTLSGTGYTATKTVNVNSGVTFAGSALTISGTQTVAANGTWSATFTVPNASNGPEQIVATDSGTATANTSFTVNAVLNVAPTAGTVGTTGVTLSGTGYKAAATINVSSGVTFGGAALTISGTQTVAANGTWLATFTVPASTHGVRSIVATDSGGANASTVFNVIAALTVSPTSGTVGTTGVTLTGTGYDAGATVDVNSGVTFGGAALTINGTQTVSATGGWTATFSVPASTHGVRTIVATDSGGANATSNFTVNTALSVSQSSGAVGTTGVTLTGTGYDAGASVYVSTGVTFGGSALTISGTQTVSATGGWSATFSVPASSNGSKAIVATDTGGANASTSFIVNAKLTVAPTSGTVGTTGVTLTGTGYDAGATVNVNNGVTFGGSALTISGTKTVSATGGWTATFSVPASSNGANAIVATDSGGANATVNFTVSAKLTVTPTSGTVGATGVTLTGTGYDAGATVDVNSGVTFGAAALTISGTQTVSATGGWTATFSVPASPNGAYAIVATDSSGAIATVNFTVNAKITVAPTSGTVGTTGVTLTGTGYDAGATVDLNSGVTFNGVPLTISGTQTVSVTGGWSATFAVPFDGNGGWTINATDSGGATANTTFAVTGSFVGITFSQTSGAGTTLCNYTNPTAVTCTNSSAGKAGTVTGTVELVDGSQTALNNASGSPIAITSSNFSGNGIVTPPSPAQIANLSALSGTYTFDHNGHNNWNVTETLSFTIEGATYSVTVTTEGN